MVGIAERLDTLEWRLWVGYWGLGIVGAWLVVLAIAAAATSRDLSRVEADTDERYDHMLSALEALRTDVNGLQAIAARMDRPRPTPVKRVVEPKTAPLPVAPAPVEGPSTQPAEIVIDRQHEELTGEWIERTIGAHTFRMRKPQ